MSDNLIDAWDDNFTPQDTPTEVKETPEQPEQTQETTPPAQEAPTQAPSEAPTSAEVEDTPPPTAEDTSEEPSEPQMSDDQVLSYLNSQLGTEYSSLAELNREEKDNEELNPIAKTFNDYAKETGRGLNDWIKLQNLSSYLNDAKDEDIVRLQFEYDNPQLTKEEVDLAFEDMYSKKAIDEDMMDEDEIAAAQKHNRLVDIRLKTEAVKAKEGLQAQVEKYKAPETPKQEQSNFDAEGFKDSYNSFLQNEIEELDFDLGDGQTFSIKVTDDLKQTSVHTPEEFLESFVDEQGDWDLDRWSTAMMAMQHIDKILKIAVNQKSSETKEEIIKKDLKNTSIDTHKKDNNPSEGKSPYKTMSDALWS